MEDGGFEALGIDVDGAFGHLLFGCAGVAEFTGGESFVGVGDGAEDAASDGAKIVEIAKAGVRIEGRTGRVVVRDVGGEAGLDGSGLGGSELSETLAEAVGVERGDFKRAEAALITAGAANKPIAAESGGVLHGGGDAGQQAAISWFDLD